MSNITFQVNCMALDAIMVFRSPRSDAIAEAFNQTLELSLLELEEANEVNVIAPSLIQHLINEEIR